MKLAGSWDYLKKNDNQRLWFRSKPINADELWIAKTKKETLALCLFSFDRTQNGNLQHVAGKMFYKRYWQLLYYCLCI